MLNDSRFKNKPSNPAPPLNALKSPEVKHGDKKPVHRSVYDEIAERRSHEKHKIGVSVSETVDETDGIIDDVKVYTPHNKTKSFEINGLVRDIYSDDDERQENVDDEDNYDVAPIPKARRRIGLWTAIISALSVLCIIAAGAYGIANGYFDGLISML